MDGGGSLVPPATYSRPASSVALWLYDPDRRMIRLAPLLLLLLLITAPPVRAAAPVRQYPTYASQNSTPTLDATKFGVVGDGVTDTRAALQAAINAAVASGQELYLPPGTYLVNLTASLPKITVTGNFKLRGAGRGKTILKSINAPTAYTMRLLQVPANKNVEIMDLTLQGPDTSGYTPPATPNFQSFGLYITATATGTGQCRVQRVDVTGHFTGAIQAETGIEGITSLLDIEQCDLTAYSVILAHYSAPNTTTRSLRVVDTTIHGAANLGNLTGEDIYDHPGNPTEVIRCKFPDNPYYSCQQFGTSNFAPAYSRWIDCTWTNPGNSLYLSNQGPSIVRGCTFAGNVGTAGIICRNAATISDCQFRSTGSGAVGINSIAASGTVLQVSNSSFANGQSLQCNGTANRWLVTNCSFDVGTAVARACSSVNRATAAFTSCRFTGAATAGAGNGCSAVECFTGATTRLRGCSFTNYWDSALTAVYIQADSTDTLIESCEFDTGRAWHPYGNAFPAGTVRHRNNVYTGGALPVFTSATGQKGSLVGGFGTTQSSAATVTLNLSGDTARINGTAAVSTLYVGSSTLAPLFSGAKVFLVAGGAWSTTTAGNLLPLTTATRAVGSISTWLYDATLSKWLELPSP